LTLRPAIAVFVLLTALLIACSGDEEDAPPFANNAVPPHRTATATSPDVTAAASPSTGQVESINWSGCIGGNGFDCALYDVPLDYDAPDGATITLAVRRLPASDEDERIGVLFANPGGPGGSAIEILSGWARALPSEIRDRFDIILFDPRGVGQSSPLVCHSNIQRLIGLDPYPETDADWKAIEDATKFHTSECAAAGGDILPHLGTRNVARDMDRLRAAMGEEKLSYLGYSYGTVIGQVYADLFPQNVRAMVLDGAVDVTLPDRQQALEQTLGFEAAFHRYVTDCTARQCIPGDPLTTIKELVAEAEDEPIPSSRGDRPLGDGEAVYAIIGSLYSRLSWPLLTLSLNAALDGDGSGLLLLVDAFVGRQPDGSYNNSTEANSAVNCLDYETDRDPLYHRQVTAEFARVAPFFGPATGQLGLYCAYWQADPEPLSRPRASGAPPIVVIGTTGDPATPYKWAVSLAEQLESGVLLTNDGEGHTAYRSSNDCIDDAVNAYLIDLQTPADGTTCGGAGIAPAPPLP
jgi:pimeloyl-ACP methyl ester carboxylesterase